MIHRRTFLSLPFAFAYGANPPANIVVLAPTGWRGQAAPWERDPDLAAPNLEKFGKQSVTFSRAYSVYPKPELAMKALETSKYPHAAKIDDAVLGSLETLAPDEAIKAFQKTPFAIRVVFSEPEKIVEPLPSSLHLRANVPSANEAAARKELAKFYGRCAAIDREIGRVLGALDDASHSWNTVVAFTSDCGQQMGSHGLEGAGVPYEESLRIPLAIRFPRKLNAASRDLASQVDIMPTVLSLAGIEIPGGVQGQDLFINAPEEFAYSEGLFGEVNEWRMLVRGYEKLVATPKGVLEQLFNLAEDPLEQTNLVPDLAQPLKLASLKAQLQLEMRKLGDGVDPSGLRIR